MKKAHTPAGGYRNGPKNHYRRDVWAFADRALRGKVPLRERRVLVLDTAEGREVEELLRRGYDSRLVTVVNRNPAELAVLQRRIAGDCRARGRLDTHGVDLMDWVYRIEHEPYDVVNLDLCSCVSGAVMGLVGSASKRLCRAGSVFAVTVQRGRETNGHFKYAGEHEVYPVDPGSDHVFPNCVSNTDALRVQYLTAAISAKGWGENGPTCCQWHFGTFRMGIYKSTGAKVSMLWLATTLRAHEEAALLWAERATVAAQLGLSLGAWAQALCNGMTQPKCVRDFAMIHRRAPEWHTALPETTLRAYYEAIRRWHLSGPVPRHPGFMSYLRAYAECDLNRWDPLECIGPSIEAVA